MQTYNVTGMSCAACQARVEKAVGKVPGVTSCAVSLLTNSMGVEGAADEAAIIKAVEDAGYGASLRGAGGSAAGVSGGRGSSASTGMTASQKLKEEEEALKDHETPIMKRRLITSAGFLMVLMYFSMGVCMWGWPAPAIFKNHVAVNVLEMLLAIIVMFINRKFFTQGFGALLHGGTNMDTLVALGSTAAFAYSLVALFIMIWYMGLGDHEMVMYYAMHHMYFESAAMIPTLITVGKMLEAMSKGRTTDALKSLMKLAPKEATVLRGGVETVVGIDDVAAGDTFVVRPGESIPVDGVIIEGHTAIDESALTGESIPVDKSEGDSVSAATINSSGYIKCRATRVGEDTTLSQIIKMVSDAAATKAPIARIADKVSAVFVPTVIGLSLLTIIVWVLLGKDIGWSIARGICVLVISCPCALGLATPVAIMVSSGVGAKNGILYKTAASLEAIGRINVIALDKTGTITAGTPVVTDIIAGGTGMDPDADGCACTDTSPASRNDTSKDELLAMAYALEAKSEHPLAKAIVEYAAAHNVTLRDVSGFEALPGNGLTARLGDAILFGGNARFISTKASLPEQLKAQGEQLAEQGKTPLYFAAASADAAAKVLGIIAVADVIKDDSAEAISQLKGMGINVVMLTGDNERTAAAIGDQAGVDRVIAGVLPDGKEKVIRSLQADGSKVAMVGDGINDAPALTAADVGVAIGAGADVAIDAADIVLMKSRLSDVAAAVRLSRRTITNIHENLFWAFFYNALCIPFAMGVYGIAMKPMYGAAAMACSSFFVCMNALRLNLVNIRDAGHDRKFTPGHKTSAAVPASTTVTPDTTDNRTQEATGFAEADTNLTSKKEGVIMAKTVSITGMMCPHCEARVKKALEGIDGVTSAQVSHEKGNAVVELASNVSDETLTKAVTDAGYEVTGIA